MNEDFLPILIEQLKELRRDITEIRTAQAAQPTRADLTAYVLKEVFDIELKNLHEKDDKQQRQIDELRDRAQSQAMRWAQNVGIMIGAASGLIALLKVILFH